jgi:uncharacterized protein
MKSLLVSINSNFMKRLFFFLLLFAISVLACYGQNIPEPMVPPRLVNDFTGLLTNEQQNTLNNKLLQFNNETSTQIYVVTYDDLQGYPAAEFASLLGEKWGIGQKGKDNGIVILVSPANHEVTIQTGYGVEGVVTDALAKRVIESEMIPAFKEGKYYEGLDKAVDVLISLTRGEYTADDYMKKTALPAILAGAVFLFVVVVMVVFAIVMRRRFYSPGKGIPWWLWLILMNSSGSSKRGSFGDFSSGSGGFGGFGGFSGGGGGSFGGGGASGSW